MTLQKHIIKTITFDTAVANEELLDRWRDTVGKINIESLFVKALQPYDMQKEWTCIDKLEIDIGEMSWENEDEWTERIFAAFEAELTDKIKWNQPGDNSPSSKFITSEKPGPREIMPIHDDHYRLLGVIDYLKTGIPPWQFERSNDMAEVLAEIIMKMPEMAERQLRVVLRNSDTAIDRLLMILEYDQLIQLLKLFSGEKIIDELLCFYEVAQNLNLFFRTKASRKELLRHFVRSSAKAGKETRPLVQELSRTEMLASLPIEKLEMLKSTAEERIGDNEILLEVLTDCIIKSRQRSLVVAKTGENTIAELATPESGSQLKDKDHDENEEEAEHLFIDNAGLILMNSSLVKYYFEKLGWVRGQDFINQRTRDKALLWLHYLTHGDQKPREYDLALNKLLCGILPSDIANIKIKLTKKEKMKANELIETIIENWTALKKISVESFRQSFLQREGRLKNEEGGWQLHVESKAYDILIEYLPWSYSVIKFPWMIKPLFTQWSTRI